MKTSKRILATAIALPLMFASLSAAAKETKLAGHRGAPMMSFIFEGVELTPEQKAQIIANIKGDNTAPKTLDLKQKPSREGHIKALFAGVELSEEQKNKMMANLEAQAKNPNRPHKVTKDRLPHTPVTLPELSQSVTAKKSPLFQGLELNKEQQEQVKANLAKALSNISTLELKQKPSMNQRMNVVFEGVTLTDVQKQKFIANLEQLDKNLKDKIQAIKDKGPAVPVTLPELSKEMPLS